MVTNACLAVKIDCFLRLQAWHFLDSTVVESDQFIVKKLNS